MPIKLERQWAVPTADRKATDRADYTQDIITNVDVTVQAERLAAVIRSSIENILAGATDAYNSGWLATGDFNKFIGTLFCDRNCTIYLEQSIDGETLDAQTTQAYTGEAYDGTFSLELTSPYVRLRIVAAINTTTFRVWNRLSSGA